MDRENVIKAGLLVLGMVLVPGMAKFALTQLGYGGVGTAVYAVGYALGVGLFWYYWIRPMDITGPGPARQPEDVDPSETDS